MLLVVLRRLRPCEHAAQVPAVRSDVSGLLRLQFIDRVRHCSCAHSDRYTPRAKLCRRPLRFLCDNRRAHFFCVTFSDGPQRAAQFRSCSREESSDDCARGGRSQWPVGVSYLSSALFPWGTRPRNSWWMCLRPYLSPLCGGLPSRALTFWVQVGVLGVAEVFKVRVQDRIQQAFGGAEHVHNFSPSWRSEAGRVCLQGFSQEQSSAASRGPEHVDTSSSRSWWRRRSSRFSPWTGFKSFCLKLLHCVEQSTLAFQFLQVVAQGEVFTGFLQDRVHQLLHQWIALTLLGGRLMVFFRTFPGVKKVRGPPASAEITRQVIFHPAESSRRRVHRQVGNLLLATPTRLL